MVASVCPIWPDVKKWSLAPFPQSPLQEKWSTRPFPWNLLASNDRRDHSSRHLSWAHLLRSQGPPPVSLATPLEPPDIFPPGLQRVQYGSQQAPTEAQIEISLWKYTLDSIVLVASPQVLRSR